jgi:hypothetical protein
MAPAGVLKEWTRTMKLLARLARGFVRMIVDGPGGDAAVV